MEPLVDVVSEPDRTVAVRPDQADRWERRWFCPESPNCAPEYPHDDSGCGWTRAHIVSKGPGR